MSDDDPYYGKVYDEDGYCVACGNGKWKHHMPQCQVADLIDAVRDAAATIRRERLYEGTPIAEEHRILAVLDAALAQIEGSGTTNQKVDTTWNARQQELLDAWKGEHSDGSKGAGTMEP